MTIVDTSVWIDYFADAENAHVIWLDEAVGQQEIGVTDLILCEVLQGVRNDRQFNRVLDNMRRFRVLGTGREDLALVAARNYRYLRKRGITVRKTIDCLIATVCIQEGHVLLHRDADFDGFERYLGLEVVHPVAH